MLLSLNEASAFDVSVAPVTGCGLMTGGAGILMPRYCSIPAVLLKPPRIPGSCWANNEVADANKKTVAQRPRGSNAPMMWLPPSRLTQGDAQRNRAPKPHSNGGYSKDYHNT